MAHEIRFVKRSLRNGLYEIFRSNPFVALISFLIIIVISSVIPLAFIWLIQCLVLETILIPVSSLFLRTILTLWSIVEVIFFIYQCYLYQKIQHQPVPPHLSSKERDELVAYTLANVKDLKSNLRKWFLDSPFEDIDRESVIGWLAFAFYAKNYEDLTPDEYKDIDLFVQKIETEHDIKAIADKPKNNVVYMKHILDHVRVIFRPLVYYFVTDTILNQILTPLVMSFRGYKFVEIGHLQFYIYYDQSMDKDKEEEPIVFFHGLGVGLLTYQSFLYLVHKKFARNRRIILISMRCISMRYPSLKDIPTMTETAESMVQLFERYQLKKAIFIGHSYGTSCLSWIVQKCPQYISRLIFIDPICFTLFEPYVVYNFVYRTPYKLGHLYLYYFVCREMGISYVVSRHFWWTQNNLYLEQIRSPSNKKIPTYVLLSERDCIVNSRRVREYLIDYNIDYHWAPKISHGGFMHDKESWEKVCQWIS